ncbi:hypothetical protein T492DRAFT_913105, partial [Pavlovales sp. CCMP2436]
APPPPPPLPALPLPAPTAGCPLPAAHCLPVPLLRAVLVLLAAVDWIEAASDRVALEQALCLLRAHATTLSCALA